MILLRRSLGRAAVLAQFAAWLALGWPMPGPAADAVVLHLSPHGNDLWSGELARPAPDGNDGPLKTLPAAIAAARRVRHTHPGLSQAITIELGSGVYPLAAPLELTAQDSGASRQAPFTLEAAPGAKPIISGGRRIWGWRPVAGKPGWWSAEIPEVRAGDWYFHELFVNGHRRQRARTPNKGFYRIQGPSPQDHPARLHYRGDDIHPNWASADGDVEVVALMTWAYLRMPIRSVDPAARVAVLSGNPRPSNRENNARYYVENAPDGLDQPGEWYLDRKSGRLTYIAMPGESVQDSVVIAPHLTQLLQIQGAPQSPVHDIVLRGLTFRYTDWTLPHEGLADTQAAVNQSGDVRAEWALRCRVVGCEFSHLAGYALEFGRGCRGTVIRHNEMFDLGAGGIRLGEPTVRAARVDQNRDNQVLDNDLHGLGRVFPSAVGVIIFQSNHNHVAHNSIHDLYYTAISVGWTWGYRESPCHDNIIEYNDLYDIGQAMLSDMGGVYTLGIQHGTVVRNNRIHDVRAFLYGGWGLYTDEGSSDILLENNLVYRCHSANFHQHYGKENVFRNNIFAFGGQYQLMRTRQESHISFIFTHNIVYYDSGNLLGSNWSNDQYKMDQNLYYDARPGATPQTMRFAGATFDQWKARGHDRHSLIADPLFVAPEKDDFRLRPDSPAFKLGFKPLDLSTVGVR